MKDASKSQEQIDAFMSEYKTLVHKYGIHIVGKWADSMELEDSEGWTVAEDIDTIKFQAKRYVRPLPMQGPRENKPPMSLSDMAKVIGSVYIPPLAESLTSNSTFFDRARNDIKKQLFGEGEKDE